jgi:hypothetical protein
MASHAQIRRNQADVHNAWAQFQTFVHRNLPASGRAVDAFTKIANTKRRYR